MDDFQISCKEKRDDVTGMGKGIKGRGWVGRTDGETGREPHHNGEEGTRGRKVLLLEGSKVEGNEIKGTVGAKGRELTGGQTGGC